MSDESRTEGEETNFRIVNEEDEADSDMINAVEGDAEAHDSHMTENAVAAEEDTSDHALMMGGYAIREGTSKRPLRLTGKMKF